MPFPSTGCQTCRARRIKCDETQPTCLRCVKAGRICQGIRKPFSEMHLENTYASGRKKRPRGPRSTLRNNATFELSKTLPRISLDINELAVNYFVDLHLRHVDEMPSILYTLCDDIISVWNPKVDNPILDLAVSSIALAIYSRTKIYPPAALEASLKYQKLLHLLQITLPVLNASNIEACLIAILFSSLYEDSIHSEKLVGEGTENPLRVRMQSFKHHDGVIAILKMWKQSSRLRPKRPINSVFKYARRMTMKFCLMRATDPPECLEKGEDFGEDGEALELDQINIWMMRMRKKLKDLPECSPREPDRECFLKDMEAIDNEMQKIDFALQKWVTQLPETWAPRQQRVPRTNQWHGEMFYNKVVHSHHKITYAAVWMRYYAFRMLVNSTRIRILARSPAYELIASTSVTSVSLPSSNTELTRCLSRLEVAADALASTLPFALQQVLVEDRGTPNERLKMNTKAEIAPNVAHLSLYPLSIATSVRGLNEQKQQWFRTWLVKIGRVMGFGIFEAAQGQSWLDL